MKKGAKLTPREQLLEKLSALPSSFPMYVRQEEQRKNNTVSEEVAAQIKAGNSALRKVTREVEIGAKISHYKNAINWFKAAIAANIANKVNPNIVNRFEIETNQKIGDCYLALSQITTDVEQRNKYLKFADKYYSKTVHQFMDGDLLYNAENNLKALALAHIENGTIETYKANQQALLGIDDQTAQLRARLALGGIARAQGKHLEAIEHYAEAWNFFQGQVDYTAHRVEQGEVGFSSSQKLGTDNVQQCVVLIIRDPDTNRTALAHIYINTEMDSIIRGVLSEFAKDNERPYEVTIVGGTDREHRQPNGKLTSDVNIEKVLDALERWGLPHTIKAADIRDKPSPSGIVFNPLTGTLEHAVPGKPDETTSARIARAMTSSQSLSRAFDLSRGPSAEVALSEQQYKNHLRLGIYLTNNPNVAPNGVRIVESWNAAQLGRANLDIANNVTRDMPYIMAKVLIEDVITSKTRDAGETVSYSPQEIKDLEVRITGEVVKLNMQGKNPAEIYQVLKPDVRKALTPGNKTEPSKTVPKVAADEASKASAIKQSEAVSGKKTASQWWRDKVAKMTTKQGHEK